ncbi:MAG: hypothetical protein [Cotesia congregata filamentous virus 2]
MDVWYKTNSNKMESLESELELACLELSMRQELAGASPVDVALVRTNLSTPTTSSGTLLSTSLPNTQSKPTTTTTKATTTTNPIIQNDRLQKMYSFLEHLDFNNTDNTNKYQGSLTNTIVSSDLFKNTLNEMTESPKFFKENTKHQILFNEHMKNSLTCLDSQYDRIRDATSKKKLKKKKFNKSIKTDTFIFIN